MAEQNVKKIYRNKVGLEDLAIGFGTETQTRNGQAVNITQLNFSNGNGGTSGGQFIGGNPLSSQPLMYLSKSVALDTTIPNGLNALAIEELIIEDGVTLTLEDEVTMKVI